MYWIKQTGKKVELGRMHCRRIIFVLIIFTGKYSEMCLGGHGYLYLERQKGPFEVRSLYTNHAHYFL